MVGQQTLDLLIQVRILAGQQVFLIRNLFLMDTEQEAYQEKTTELLRLVSEKRPEPETDDSQRKPSTGSPQDYVYIEDLTDIGKGRRVCFSTKTMPKDAEEAFHLWTHGRSHESCRSYIRPNARKFKNIMGFSAARLVKAAEELERNISK